MAVTSLSKWRLYWVFLLVCGIGCIPSPNIPAVEPCKQTAFYGLFVLNEGNLGLNNATLDYYDEANGYTRCADIFPQVASTVLGDVAHSVWQEADTVFVVMNNSRTVYKMLLPSLRRIGECTLPPWSSPRRMWRQSPEKAYLTSLYGGDTLFTIDPRSMQVTGKINVGRYQEGLAGVGDKLFVAVDAFTNRALSRIAVVDTRTDSVTRFISLPIKNPSQVLARDGKIYVNCIGDYNPAGAGSAVVVIDAATEAIERVYSFTGSIFDLDFVPDGLLVLRDSTIDQIQLLTGETRMSFLTRRGLTGNGKDILYGMTFDAERNLLYLCNAKDYVSNGECIVLSPLGEVIAKLPAGPLPKTVFYYR